VVVTTAGLEEEEVDATCPILTSKARLWTVFPSCSLCLTGSLVVMRGFSSDSISGVTAANLAPNPRATEKLPPLKRSPTPPPIGTIGRHFSSRRFADAPISDA